jgi:hypothetical protein
MLVRDGVEADVFSSASAFANLAAVCSIAASGTKKRGARAAEKIRSIISSAMPYVDMDSEAKSEERESEELLANARKEAEILKVNPHLSAYDFLTAKRGDRK